MRVIESDNVVMVDVDDTLVCWNLSDFPDYDRTIILHVNGPVAVVPHQPNINTLIKFWKLGYTVIVWSGSGWLWAKNVVEQLGLTEYVHSVQSKPRWHFDDKPAETWMGSRVYRDPKTGSES